MFSSFKKREAEVLNHWIAAAEGYQCQPTEFYQSVEHSIKERCLPGLEMTRVDFAEGGALSHKRTYLRMIRERLVFDICAAQFGNGSFFSCRMAQIPVVVHLSQLAIVIIGLLIVLYLSMRFVGVLLGPIVLMALLLGACYVLRNAVAMGLRDLDTALIRSPLLGAIYEAWFRKETYYRVDTRLIYLDTVSNIVKKLAEDVTGQKGVRLTRQYELAPILGELYKPVRPQEPPLPPNP
jgi:hypothetical protein